MRNRRNHMSASALGQFTAAFLAVAWLSPQPGMAASRAADYVQSDVAIAGAQTLNITFPNGYYISGSVRDASNQPLTGAAVMAAGQDGTIYGWGLTDSSGAYQIPVRAGTYNVVAAPPRVRVINPSTMSRLVPAAVKSRAVAADASVPAIALQNGYLLTGSFLPPSGQMAGLAGGMQAIPQKGDWFTGGMAAIGDGGHSTQYGVALPSGKYTLLFAGGQAFDSSWKMLPAAAFAVQSVNLTKDTTKNIKLPKGYSLTGTANDAGGNPLHGIIYVRPKGANPAKDRRSTLITVMNGKFVANLPAGTYDCVFIPGMPSGYTGKATRSPVELTMPAAAKTLDIVAAEGVIVSGKMKDAGGAVSPGAMLWLVLSGADPKSLDAIPMAAVAAQNGAYRVSVPPGTYDVHAWPGVSDVDAILPDGQAR